MRGCGVRVQPDRLCPRSAAQKPDGTESPDALRAKVSSETISADGAVRECVKAY